MLAVAMAVMPTMAFMGVRISWDILDKNSLLARLACSASFWAASAARRASSTSRSWARVSWKYLKNTSSRAARITAALSMASPAHCRVKLLITLSMEP